MDSHPNCTPAEIKVLYLSISLSLLMTFALVSLFLFVFMINLCPAARRRLHLSARPAAGTPVAIDNRNGESGSSRSDHFQLSTVMTSSAKNNVYKSSSSYAPQKLASGTLSDPLLPEGCEDVVDQAMSPPPQSGRDSSVTATDSRIDVTVVDKNHDQNQGTPKAASVLHYVVHRSFVSDVVDVGEVKTLSQFATNSVRGNQTLLVATFSVAFNLSFLVGLNELITPGEADKYTWAIVFGYLMLLLVGLFPSNDITNDRRDYNVFLCCSIAPFWSSMLHAIGALVYLFVPAVTNVIWYSKGDSKDETNVVVSLVGIGLSLSFVLSQSLVEALQFPGLRLGLGKYFELVSIKPFTVGPCFTKERHVWFFLIELIAFLYTTTAYFYLEISDARKNTNEVQVCEST